MFYILETHPIAWLISGSARLTDRGLRITNPELPLRPVSISLKLSFHG